MNLSTGLSGTSVINMRAFDPDLVGSIFTRVDLSWSREARAKFVVSSMGDLSLIRSRHSAVNSKSRRLERHMRAGDESYYFACMPLEGGVEVRHLGRESLMERKCELKTSHLTLIKSTEEYEIAMSDQLDAIWLRIPARQLRAHAISVDELLGRPLDVQGGLGYVAKQMMCCATSETQNLADRGARIFSQSLLSFLGEVIDTNLGTHSVASSIGRRKILKRAQDYIEEHIHDEDLSPAQIAQGIGISGRYLSEVFSAEGSSPMRWVRERRLELCRMELDRKKGGQQLICEIAYSMGFTNVSSFNRAFKAHFGLSPRDLIAQNAPEAKGAC